MSKILEIITAAQPVDYAASLEYMQQRAKLIAANRANEALWLLEHPHVYTGGNTAGTDDFLDAELSRAAAHKRLGQLADNAIKLGDESDHDGLAKVAQEEVAISDMGEQTIPIHYCDRGGQVTYHGPGQRIIYMMLDLRSIYGKHPDIRNFVLRLQRWIGETLAYFEILVAGAEQVTPGIGLWVPGSGFGEFAKIGAIGLKVSRGITYHGAAVNINTDLRYFDKIKACAIEGCQHISMALLKNQTTEMAKFDAMLLQKFSEIFPEYVEYTMEWVRR